MLNSMVAHYQVEAGTAERRMNRPARPAAAAPAASPATATAAPVKARKVAAAGGGAEWSEF